MATGKRYYWMKLKKEFLEGEEVAYLLRLPGGVGNKALLIYELLCVKAINSNGKLETRIGNNHYPFDIDIIEKELKWFTKDDITAAMDLLQNLGWIFTDTNGTFVISDFKNLVGGKSDYAIQKQAQREKTQSSRSAMDNDVDNVHTESDSDSDSDSDPFIDDEDGQAYVNGITESFLQEFGRHPLPEEISQIIFIAVPEGFSLDATLYAVHLAARNGAKNPAPYVRTIMMKWLSKNLKTLDSINEANRNGDLESPSSRSSIHDDLPY